MVIAWGSTQYLLQSEGDIETETDTPQRQREAVQEEKVRGNRKEQSPQRLTQASPTLQQGTRYMEKRPRLDPRAGEKALIFFYLCHLLAMRSLPDFTTSMDRHTVS